MRILECCCLKRSAKGMSSASGREPRLAGAVSYLRARVARGQPQVLKTGHPVFRGHRVVWLYVPTGLVRRSLVPIYDKPLVTLWMILQAPIHPSPSLLVVRAKRYWPTHNRTAGRSGAAPHNRGSA